jgi:hypothetical protein
MAALKVTDNEARALVPWHCYYHTLATIPCSAADSLDQEIHLHGGNNVASGATCTIGPDFLGQGRTVSS